MPQPAIIRLDRPNRSCREPRSAAPIVDRPTTNTSTAIHALLMIAIPVYRRHRLYTRVFARGTHKLTT